MKWGSTLQGLIVQQMVPLPTAILKRAVVKSARFNWCVCVCVCEHMCVHAHVLLPLFLGLIYPSGSTFVYTFYTYQWHQNMTEYITLVFDLVVVHTTLFPAGRGKLTLQRTFLKKCICLKRERIPEEKLSHMFRRAHMQDTCIWRWYTPMAI